MRKENRACGLCEFGDTKVAKLERDPENEHHFILNIDGVSVFQWFRDMARKLLEKLGFKPRESRKGPPLGR